MGSVNPSPFKPSTQWVTTAYNPGVSGGLATRMRNRQSDHGDIKLHVLNCLHGGFDRSYQFAEETPWSIITIREAIMHLVRFGVIRRCRIRNAVGQAMRYELVEKEDCANT